MSAPHNITPTNSEIVMADDEFIVSKADLQGRLTYANRIFMRMALLSEKELLHKNHNIIRHPDMPSAVFKLLWQVIGEKKEFFGFVKNISTDGRYYWVFANITPDYTATGEHIGFFSVRRKPPRSAIDIIDPLYREMLRIERASSSKQAGQEKSLSYLQDHLKQLGVDYQAWVINLFNQTSGEA